MAEPSWDVGKVCDRCPSVPSRITSMRQRLCAACALRKWELGDERRPVELGEIFRDRTSG